MCERNKWLKTQFLKVPRQGHANAKVLPMSQGIRSSGPESANLKKKKNARWMQRKEKRLPHGEWIGSVLDGLVR